MKYLEAQVFGRVQMVRYRVTVKGYAERLGIIGSVQNMSDGSVYVRAWGEESALQEFLRLLWKGSRLSRVDKVVEIWENKQYDHPQKIFRIIR